MKEVFPSQKRKLLTLTSSVLSKKYSLYVNSSRTSGHLTQKLGLKKQNHTGTGDAGKNATDCPSTIATGLWDCRLQPLYQIFALFQLRAWRSTLFRFLVLVLTLANPRHFLSSYYYVSISYLYNLWVQNSPGWPLSHWILLKPKLSSLGMKSEDKFIRRYFVVNNRQAILGIICCCNLPRMRGARESEQSE